MKIIECDKSILKEYSKIPISFSVESILNVVYKNNGLDGYDIVEEKIDKPYIKNYDDHNEESFWQGTRFSVKKQLFTTICNTNRFI